jgi:hypothetical protein
MASFCPLDHNGDFEEPLLFTIKDHFQNTAAIQWMHEAPLRFGHTRNIQLYISGDKSDKDNYVTGLVGSSIAMCYFFLVWIVLLILFKFCLGPKRVGFLSGSTMTPLLMKPNPFITTVIKTIGTGEFLEDDIEGAMTHEQYKKFIQHQEEWRTAKTAARRRLNSMRILVLIAGASIIVCAGLMVAKGATSLVDSVDGSRDALAHVSNLTQQGIALIDRFDTIRQKAATSLDTLLEKTNRLCPLVREKLCTDIFDPKSCNLQDIPYPEDIQTVIDYFDGTKGLVFDEVIKFRADLVTIQERADNMDQKAATFNWAFWVASALALALAVLCFLMMIGVILAWLDRLPRIFYCFRMLVVVPLFILLGLVAWGFSMVFLIGSLALADTCINSPDGTVLTVVEKYRDQMSSIATDFLIYYITGK